MSIKVFSSRSTLTSIKRQRKSSRQFSLGKKQVLNLKSLCFISMLFGNFARCRRDCQEALDKTRDACVSMRYRLFQLSLGALQYKTFKEANTSQWQDYTRIKTFSFQSFLPFDIIGVSL